METILNSIAGLGHFAAYFAVSIVLLFIFKIVYAFVTPHDEWKLVKQEKNLAAAIGFGGAIIGFALALSSAVANSLLCQKLPSALSIMKFPQVPSLALFLLRLVCSMPLA